MSPVNRHGVLLAGDGTVRFRLWAPACDRVRLELSGTTELLTMSPLAEGWHELITDRATPGSRYRFVLPDGMRVPDPASRYQPEDVHGPSEVIDLSLFPSDAAWKGRPWEQAVLYELHVGTFTVEGTFRGAISRLDYLVDLGITGIEIMPVADFPGRRNWGYDGVFYYAPDASYGRPEDLRALVDAAHSRGLMVLLDVVYNHFGPEGNYLHLYAPQFFNDRHHTPWGAAINYDGPGCAAVRDFVVHNAIYWIEQFHLDGLRLDAVDTILDESPNHILHELAERVYAAVPDRHVHLILENGRNEARWLERDFTAQWNDDVHHALHTVATGENSGYYADYLGDTVKLGRALAEGFAFQGDAKGNGKTRGEPSAHLPPTRFVAYLQNHDQIGNRAFGDRISTVAPYPAVRAAVAVYLLLPQIPMLFMGEEWNAVQSFPFFCDFGSDLAEAVRTGRRNEFAGFAQFQDPEMRERIPDPMSEDTFASARICWEDANREEHRTWLDRYRRMLATRRRAILPLLSRISRSGTFTVIGPGAVQVVWLVGESSRLTLSANLSAQSVSGFAPEPPFLIWREGGTDDEGRTLQAWSVVWASDVQGGAG